VIVLTKFQRREINAGRRVDLRLTEKPSERAGHSYAVLAEKGKRTSIRVEVMAAAQVEGGWVLSLKMAPQQRRLLHRDSSHGYTENPVMALQGEPEAVSEFEQEQITAEAHERFRGIRSDEVRRREERARLNRLRDLERRAQSQGLDLSPLHEAIDREIARFSQRVTQAA
jgi:hypothetical protein